LPADCHQKHAQDNGRSPTNPCKDGRLPYNSSRHTILITRLIVSKIVSRLKLKQRRAA
jgi:hypothetical protein